MTFRLSGLRAHWLMRLQGNPNFTKLWFGQTVSVFGSHITGSALPFIALITLSATPEQMGVLTAAASLPVLIFGLIAGVWVDRLPRRPLMIAADLVRFFLVLTLPLMALTGNLTMVWVYAVAALMGVFSLVFNLAYRAFLPSLVAREDLLLANTRLATTDALAEVGGPSIAGLLIQALTAPMAVLVDAFTFLVSVVSIGLIRTPPPSPFSENSEGESFAHFRRELVEGVRLVFTHPVLRVLTLGTTLRSFFGAFIGTLYSLFAIRDLGMSPALVGIIISFGGVGALVGSVLAGRLSQRRGMGRVLSLALLVGGVANLLLPLAGGSVIVAAGMLIASQLINDAAMAIYLVNEMTLRQMLVEERWLGRANATVGFLAEGIAPLGGIAAGILAGSLGARTVLWVAVLGILATGIWLALSPVRHVTVES